MKCLRACLRTCMCELSYVIIQFFQIKCFQVQMTIYLNLTCICGVSMLLYYSRVKVKEILDWLFQGGDSFADPFCYLCSMSVMLSCLFIAAFWSCAGKGLTSWLSCMWCFLVFLSLSHVVSWVRCGTWLYRFLIFAFFLTFTNQSEQKWWKQLSYLGFRRGQLALQCT